MIRDDVAKLMKKVPIDAMILGIGDVARATGVSQSQLRYWERKGYIESQGTPNGGNRKFSYKTVIQVEQIKTFLDEGYTLTAAVARARKRKAYADVLRSFFEERFTQLEIDDDQAMIDLGVFDPEPTKHLVAYQAAGRWQFKLVAPEL